MAGKQDDGMIEFKNIDLYYNYIIIMMHLEARPWTKTFARHFFPLAPHKRHPQRKSAKKDPPPGGGGGGPFWRFFDSLAISNQ